MRKVFALHLLGKKRVKDLRTVREEETALLVTMIRESSKAVDLNVLFNTLTNDMECRNAFGMKYSGENKKDEQVKHLLSELIMLLGAFTFGDFIPMLGWLDNLNGMNRRVKKVVKGIDEFLEGLLEERMVLLDQKIAQGVNLEDDKQYIVDILLLLQKDNDVNITLNRDNIKALLLNAYTGGTEVISAFMEWAMTELLANTNIMKKLQKEIREVLNGKIDIGDDDLEKMVYLKAVIKETFRIHPPIAMFSRTTLQDTKIMGYDIAQGTMILFNIWGMGQDSKSWDEPHMFRPERFLNSSIDFQGHDLEFIPFGSGRRQCPGISYTSSVVQYVLATLLYKFDWEFPGAIKGEQIDLTEKPGSAVHQKKIHLQAIATPFSY